MGLLAVNDQKTIIDAEIVQKVTALCDWQYRARRRFDPIDVDSKMARLEEKIRRILETGPKTKRDLVRGSNANRSGMWVFETALQNLVRAGEVSLDKKAGANFFKTGVITILMTHYNYGIIKKSTVRRCRMIPV